MKDNVRLLCNYTCYMVVRQWLIQHTGNGTDSLTKLLLLLRLLHFKLKIKWMKVVHSSIQFCTKLCMEAVQIVFAADVCTSLVKWLLFYDDFTPNAHTHKRQRFQAEPEYIVYMHDVERAKVLRRRRKNTLMIEVEVADGCLTCSTLCDLTIRMAYKCLHHHFPSQYCQFIYILCMVCRWIFQCKMILYHLFLYIFCHLSIEICLSRI